MLTRAVSLLQIRTEAPEDAATGGLDFTANSTLKKVKEELKVLATQTHNLVVHFAPPVPPFP